MPMTFFQLARKLNEAAPPPPPPTAPPPAMGADPMAGGGGTPPPMPGGDPMAGGMGGAAPGAPGATGGKPKIIKIDTVWDALEDALGGNLPKPENKQAPKDNNPKEMNKPKSLFT